MECNYCCDENECAFQKTHNYCYHCGIVFEIDEAEGCCPFCVLREDLSWEEQKLIVFQRRRNKLNRQISTLKKAAIKN